MAETKGITIEFRGDVSDFEKAVKTINNDIRSTKSEITLLNKELKLDPKNVELLAKKFDALKTKEKELVEQVRVLEDGLSKLDPTKDASKWNQYSTALNRAKGDLIELQGELKKFGDMSSDQIAKLVSTTKGLEDWGKSLEKISKKLDAVGKKLSVISAGIVGLTTAGVKYNAQLEQYQTAFTTLIGDSEKAFDTISKIQEDASKSPFDTASLIEANQYLISAGVEADESRQFINALGDAIASTGGGSAELSRMAQNLQQIKNLGKASAVDIKQFANAGINIYGLLAETTGKSVEQLKEMDITYEQLLEAFTKASQEGGKYFGAMENQSQTLNGAISTLKDSISQLLGQLTESLVPIIKNIVTFINDLVNKLKAMSVEQQAMITKIALIVASLSPLVLTISKIVGAIGGISKGIALILKNEKIITFIAKVASNGGGLVGVLKTLVSMFVKLINPINVIIAILVLLYVKCETFRNAVNGLVVAIWGLVKSAFSTLIEILKVAFAIIGQVINVLKLLWQNFNNSQAGQQFITFLNNVIKLVTNIINWFKSLVDWLGKIFKWFGDLLGVATNFKNVTGSISSKLSKTGSQVNLMQSGGMMSDGMMSNSIVMNNTFTITTNDSINQSVVERWADVLTDRINLNLGRMV